MNIKIHSHVQHEPRPVKFPHVICAKDVRWNTPGVCLDHCDRWYHQKCKGMQYGVYYGLTNASCVSVHCGLPNFPENIFDTTIFLKSNSFSYLNETNNTNTAELMPLHFLTNVIPGRSDLPLRVLVLNCQSIKTPGKPAQL